MSGKSLDAFVKEKKLTDCPVCKLPKEIRKQIRERKEGVNLLTVIAWLRTQGHRITEPQLTGHLRGGHERGQ